MRAPGRYSPISHDQIEDGFEPDGPQWADVEHDPEAPRRDPVGFTSTGKRIEHLARQPGRHAEVEHLAMSAAADRYDLRKRHQGR